MNSDFQPGKLSKSGAPVYVHNKVSPKIEGVADSSESIDLIDKQIQKFFPDSEVTVWHEIVSDIIHVDIHWIKSNKDRNYHILLTSGMSSLPMNTPKEYEHYQYAELAILLPNNWKFSPEDFKDENNYWPIRKLKELARLPHTYNTWLCEGHTIDNGNPAVPMASNVNFTGTLLFASFTLPENFTQIETDEKTINIFSLYPLYTEEMQYKLDNGMDALLEKFEKFEVDEIIDINRKNTCKQ